MSSEVITKKRGRPFKSNKRDRRVAIFVDASTEGLLQQYASITGVSLSELGRNLVELGIRAKYECIQREEF